MIRIGAAAALAAPAEFAGRGAPKFFTPAEFAMLDELTEMIIPADDHSPGARAAQWRHISMRALAEAFEPKERDQWRKGCRSVDRAVSQDARPRVYGEPPRPSASRCSTRMAQNEDESQELLKRCSFSELKHATAHAYYTSKIGIHQEMEYKGNVLLNEFVGTELP